MLLAKDNRKEAETPPGDMTNSEELLRFAAETRKDPKTYLDLCSQKFPKSAQIWLALINLSMHQAEKEPDDAQKAKKWEEVSRFIDDAEKNLGDHPVIREKRGSCAVRRKDPQVVDVLKRLGENIGKMDDSERSHLWGSLAALCVQANEFELARSYCRRIAESEPKNILVRYLLCDLNFRLYEKGQAPDLREVDKMIGEMEQQVGGGPFWLYAKAIRAIVQSKKPDPQALTEARGYLKDAMEMRKDWSALTVLLGKICEMQDQPEQALEQYDRAIRHMGERDSDVIRRTVQLLLSRGRGEDLGEAKSLFDYLEKQKSPLLSELSQERDYVMAFTGDITRAAEEVGNSVPAGSKDYKDYFRQGQLYGFLARRVGIKAQQAGRDPRVDKATIAMMQKAVTAMLKAADMNPQAGEVWVSLVQLLADIGQPDKATVRQGGRPMSLMEQAESALKGDDAPLALARCWELLNEPEKAEAKYLAAVEAGPKNCRVLRQAAGFYRRRGKPDLAEPLLRKIISLETPATLAEVCWARHSLANIVAARGDFKNLCEAVDLIDKNLGSKAASIEDRRAKLLLLRSDPRKQKSDEALQFMEDLVKGSDATPDDSFALAKFYLKKGNRAAYEKQMHGLLAAGKAALKPEYVEFYVNTLLEKKQLDDADTWLQTLEKAAPDLFTTVRLRAEYQFLRGNYEAADNLLMAFFDNPKAQPQVRGQQLLLVAQVMESFSDRLKGEGNKARAAKFAERADLLFGLQRGKKVSALGEVFFANYLARQKRVDECLKVLEQCWSEVPADRLQTPANLLLASRDLTAAQYVRLEQVLVQASDKAGRSAPLLSVLATLHGQRQQYEKAIADYRAVLAKDPGNYQVMNNLGVNLARAGQNLDEALKLLNGAVAICGPLAEVLDSRAVVYIARQEPEKALEDLAAAVKDDGTAAQYFHQAWAYSLAGKNAEAAAAFKEAAKRQLERDNLDPREASVYVRLKDSF